MRITKMVSEFSGSGVLLAVSAVILIILVYILAMGSIALYLVSMVFPEYIIFEWHFYKILALGVLILLVTIRSD